MKKIDYTSKIFDLSLFGRGRQDLLKITPLFFENSSKLSYIATPNPEQIVLSNRQKTFKTALQSADILLPDGVGLVLASTFLAAMGKVQPLTERITGIDFAQDLIKEARSRGKRCLVIGGREYDKHVLTPSSRFEPAQEILADVYWFPGYANVKNPTSAEENQVRQVIESVQPAVVFVAFGAPAQEEWIVSHREWLEEKGVKVAMVVGGAFDVLVGKVNRAPAWVQNLGLEWFYRLIQEPWRAKRQLQLITFIWMVIREMGRGKKN